jgi:hypothetical protein
MGTYVPEDGVTPAKQVDGDDQFMNYSDVSR